MHLSPASGSHQHKTGEARFGAAAELLALLADRTRLRILYELTSGEADVTSLAEVCGAARPAVSQHLARLRLAGLVTTRKDGRRVIYALKHTHLHHLITQSLALADHLTPPPPTPPES
ncbi:metalloregulator ArsR/SmtB family transcription factor [Actinocorallia sp. API 0066]|uniref:ArsR/SmtB family transcription factor n=1 Tax=Actinocorallia sp. API 0066 TaxID=2896846 RepID=UPI001E412180|nr:metalloregulator ArsR/SmtB family transcription factor [Actinocorallia sp. API 0066]MCD0449145.1 metalloregulator ArsR/SmtB family transcription factor [Actinocorallia sp. API 0066]